MTAWLDPLRAALDDAPAPVVFFFRDDDAGWRDDRLAPLLDMFEASGSPIDLAAIPCAVSPTLSRALRVRHRAAPGLVRLHQHGFSHANHEPAGRKCEFGPARTPEQQRVDVLRGYRALRERVDVELDPIFTPPWNRCTDATARAIRDAGLRVLSRESGAEPLASAVRELPISVDWLRRRRGVPLTRAELGVELGREARGGGPVGVMLHHAVMRDRDLQGVGELLRLLTTATNARLSTMIELAPEEVAA
jgi:hypothetical protein